MAHDNKELLSQIKDLVSSSISDVKRSSDANSSKQISEIKRLKRDAPPSFNKRSNEDQYKATKCVLEGVKDAHSSLERKDLPKTKEHLEKDIFSTDLWATSHQFSQEVAPLMDKLKSTVLASRAPGTSLNYMRIFNRWRSFATEVLGIVAMFPVEPIHCALFLQYLLD